MADGMRLGVALGYWGAEPWDPIDLVLEAERLGFDSCWSAEAYGSDAFSPLAWIGARTKRIKLGTGIVQLATEIADGWLPMFASPYRFDICDEALSGRPEGFEIACAVTVMLNDDVAEALNVVRWYLAFYIGGMGAADQNFHLNVIARMGFEDEAREVQKLFLDGRRDEAAAAVPEELADEISLCGPAQRIRERLDAWVRSPVTTIIAGTRDPAALKVLADSVL